VKAGGSASGERSFIWVSRHCHAPADTSHAAEHAGTAGTVPPFGTPGLCGRCIWAAHCGRGPAPIEAFPTDTTMIVAVHLLSLICD
jgi:hypothetical protein